MCELMILFDDKIKNYTDHLVLLEHSAKKQVTLGIAGFLDFDHCLVLQMFTSSGESVCRHLFIWVSYKEKISVTA